MSTSSTSPQSPKDAPPPPPPRPAAALILAGGASTRMGRWKAALPWDDPCAGASGGKSASKSGKKSVALPPAAPTLTLLEAHQRAWLAAGAAPVVVVLAAQFEAEGCALILDQAGRPGRGKAVLCSNPDAPLFHSFALGARAALAREPELTWLAVTPVDAPPLTPDALRAMLKIAKKSKAPAVRTCAFDASSGSDDDGPALRHGHPVVLARAALDALLALDPATARLDHWLRDQDPADLRGYAIDDPRLLANMNTPAEYEAARSAFRAYSLK